MSEWPEVRISVLASIDIGGTPSRVVPSFWAEKPDGFPWLSIADMKGKFIDETKEHISALGVRASNVTLIPDHTTVMSFKLTVGRTAVVTREMYCNEAIAIFQPKDERLDTRWLYHALPGVARNVVTDTAVKGATLNKAKMAEMKVKLPSLIEQSKIAQILDTLDTAIAQTEAIIAKLKAVKQGLLHDLLTRGIDANGELRPPQSEAPQLYKESPLGWIPKEWEASQLHILTELITSGSRGWAAYYADAGALFLRSQNVRMGYLEFTDRQLVSPPIGGEGARTKLEQSDLLITITGNGVGNVAHVPVDWVEAAYVSQHVGLVRFHDPRLALLAAHYFVEGAPGNQQIVSVQYGQSKPGLSLGNLRSFWMPTSSGNEVSVINDRIASAYGRLNREESLAHQLRDLKLGLMDDLLTGRVRVTSLLVGTEQEKECV